jgi:L-ribulose-5-phosphate 3-epimerase
MPHLVNRRTLLGAAAAAMLGGTDAGRRVAGAAEVGAPATSQPSASPLLKALSYSMLPGSLPVADRFKLTADLGFHGVEVATVSDDREVDTLRVAADKASVRIHSVMASESWTYPLSDNDPAKVEKGLEVLRRSLQCAKALGADTVLFIPAVVTPEVRYKDAWERSQKQIRKTLPLARELGVTIAVENVGNRFLLSPLEFARYVDEYADPFLQAYFDVGNALMLWGYPQDWILTLGSRIRKIHLKDCDFARKRFLLLRDGDVNWPAVRRAIGQIGYSGFLTVEPNYKSPELERGDRAYLQEISRRVDLILEGK